MANNISGINSYKQTEQAFLSGNTNKSTAKKSISNADTSQKTASTDKLGRSNNSVKVTEWKKLADNSSLIPTTKDGYGTVIGDVELSDTAKEYLNKLKEKYHGMEFIVVSSDIKDQVAKNAAAYGNSNKMVVLIDTDKLERMATDETFRKKYEGIIESSQIKIQNARNTLASSGASIMNFGMSVSENGEESFFATIEKASVNQRKIMEKNLAKKKEQKAQEKKEAKKEEVQKRLDKIREGAKDNVIDKNNEKVNDNNKVNDNGNVNDNDNNKEKEYLEFSSSSLDDLIDKISRYTHDNSYRNAMTETEKSVGQNIDFVG